MRGGFVHGWRAAGAREGTGLGTRSSGCGEKSADPGNVSGIAQRTRPAVLSRWNARGVRGGRPANRRKADAPHLAVRQARQQGAPVNLLRQERQFATLVTRRQTAGLSFEPRRAAANLRPEDGGGRSCRDNER